MISPSDKDYKDTKLVKQGKKVLSFPAYQISEWINNKYNVNILNVFFDTIHDNLPRMNIIFEFQKDVEKFKTWNGNVNFDIKNNVAIRFREILENSIPNTRYLKKAKLLKFRRFISGELLVIFTAFEPIATIEANMNIPEKEIQKFQSKLHINDLWKIYRFRSQITFFFYTELQARENEANGTADHLFDEYFTLLKKYDEFNYIRRHNLNIFFDSKENFDNNYQSNWYFYNHNVI